MEECFPEAREPLWGNSTVSQLVGISFQYYAADVICLYFISSVYLPAVFLFYPSFTWVFCSLGLLYRKTLIECLLMLWPLCLHPAFSAALIPSGSAVKNLPAMLETQETGVRSLGQEDPLDPCPRRRLKGSPLFRPEGRDGP